MGKDNVVAWTLIFLCLGLFCYVVVEAKREGRFLSDGSHGLGNGYQNKYQEEAGYGGIGAGAYGGGSGGGGEAYGGHEGGYGSGSGSGDGHGGSSYAAPGKNY
ncbi:hypothetical protein PVL29_023673 [Vitis rotundifolia]|uniref:Uncharacterized protein n=1 Tax=Vitis rotundifolia TaxID=103349 RepID=A0AA38YPN3_VITRO|nr:hypothetical protein PVL29_023673 [Vitis rotundifolia]